MKKIIMVLLLLACLKVRAQNAGSVTVGGDLDKFYPTLWTDGGWSSNTASVLEIGRSSTHVNGDWRGTVIAKFSYHTYAWGNGAGFLNADVTQVNNLENTPNDRNRNFIAGWRDATIRSGSGSIIIWLRGGGTTYYYKSLYANAPVVYDGVANPLPFQEENGPAHSYKTTKDPYVNSDGLSRTGTAYFNGVVTPNYFAGDVGVGTLDTKGYKLAVNGKVRAQEIKVETANWPDYVFAKDYVLPSLKETEKHIQEKGHLPGIPSAQEVKNNGVDLGEMNAKLLKKIEELTLYLIQKDKELEQVKADNKQTREMLLKMKKD
jgi:hypothetical protein